MSNVQSMFALGALMMFGIISLRFDSAVIQNAGIEAENTVYLTAFSLADDLLEEMKQRAFDEQTITFQSISFEALTPVGNLGRDADEIQDSSKTFDDLDDYNNYSKPVSLPHAENYTVISHVNYVTENDQDVVSSTPTYYKRIEITVDSPYLDHEIKLSYIFTLHSK